MKGQKQWVTKGDTNSKEAADSNKQNKESQFLCFVERASLYNFVNKAYLLHNLFLVYLFLLYFSTSTYFRRLCAHHQEQQLCLCDTWYLLFCMDPQRITSTKCRINTVVSTDDGHIVGRNMQRLINILRINLCTKLVLFTKLSLILSV